MWKAIFDQYGYIPTGIGCHSVVADTRWDAFSDTGGYAHLIAPRRSGFFIVRVKPIGKRSGVDVLGRFADGFQQCPERLD